MQPVGFAGRDVKSWVGRPSPAMTAGESALTLGSPAATREGPPYRAATLSNAAGVTGGAGLITGAWISPALSSHPPPSAV